MTVIYMCKVVKPFIPIFTDGIIKTGKGKGEVVSVLN